MLHRVPAIEKIGEAIGWSPTLELDLVLADVIKQFRTAFPTILATESVEVATDG
jgi:hypothetical protein